MLTAPIVTVAFSITRPGDSRSPCGLRMPRICLRSQLNPGSNGHMPPMDEHQLKQKWDALPKTWSDIYRWGHIGPQTYSETIADWILASFGSIALITDGLRNSFRADNHHGQIDLQTPINPPNEERIVRALFNASRLDLLGVTVDYEVPLSGPDGRHGDIDLLCRNDDTKKVFCVEAKSPTGNTSILKPVLQAYTYTMLIQSRRDQFDRDFGLAGYRVCSAVLSFAGTISASQMSAIHEWPRTWALIRELNQRLKYNDLDSLRFFLFEPDGGGYDDCLDAAKQENGDIKAVFRQGFRYRILEKTVL